MKKGKANLKKWLGAFTVLILFLGIYGCTEDTQTTNETSAQKSNEEEQEEETKKELDMPVIKGSQAYDVILSLEDAGIPKADTQTKEYGYRYDSVGTSEDYSIITNKNHEIGYARFNVLLNGNPQYLSFCASLPNDDYDVTESVAWVEENINNNTSTQFNNTIFEISQTNTGPSLTIKAVGWDEYYLNITKES